MVIQQSFLKMQSSFTFNLSSPIERTPQVYSASQISVSLFRLYIVKANPVISLNSLCLEKCWPLLHILNVNGVESMKYQHNDAEFRITDGKQKITDNASTILN